MRSWEPDPQRCWDILSLLGHSDWLEPVPDEPDDVTLWLDFNLASLAEIRLGEMVDADQIGEGRRDDLIRRAAEGRTPQPPRREHQVPFWIVHQGRHVGTVAVGSPLGAQTVELASLYIRPDDRRQGIAGAVLRAVCGAMDVAGLAAIRLETNWCWQPAVSFYVANRMWVYGWKRELVFVWWPELPTWELEVDGDEARFVTRDRNTGHGTPLIVARRERQRLHWHVVERTEVGPASRETGLLAPATLAVALALRGWPLIQSDDGWATQLARGGSDMGGPEELAWKIRLWEAWARHSAWRVETPRIPGLDYPSWEELDETDDAG